MASRRYCLVIPHYRHERPLIDMLDSLVSFGMPIYVVDDASGDAVLSLLRTAIGSCPSVTLIERSNNGGKGAAMMTGLSAAYEAGFSHALSIDADGQHNVEDIYKMLGFSEQEPQHLITGSPIFGEDIPSSRLHGRKLTNGLVRLETGKIDFPDAMCGFRVYPLALVIPLFSSVGYRTRMEFDVEILVRAAWAGVPVTSMETQVVYPKDGRSHFNMVADNFRLTVMHILLLVGGLLRLPLKIMDFRVKAGGQNGQA